METRASTKHEGRALTVTFILIIVVSGYFFIAHWYKNNTSPSKNVAVDSDSDIRDITFWKTDAVKERQTAGEKIVFLDLRPSDTFTTEHILDAVWVPQETLGGFMPKAGSVYVIVVPIDMDVQTLKETNDVFKRKKMSYAFLQGGIDAWRSSGEATISYGNPNSYLDQSKVTYLTAEQARALLESSPEVLPLDVRNEKAFQTSHLPRAINIPLALLEKNRALIPSGHPLIVYGENELEGFLGAVRAFDMHFFGPRLLKGGFPTWQDKKFPVEP